MLALPHASTPTEKRHHAQQHDDTGHARGHRSYDANADDAPVAFWLTVLHNNDGELQLIDAGSDLQDFGGVARFATLVNNLRANAPGSPAAEDNQDGNLNMFDVTSFIMAYEAGCIDG